MKNIYIYGLGKGYQVVERCLSDKGVSVIGYIDNFKAESQKEKAGIRIISQREIIEAFDYIVVTLMQYENLKEQLVQQGIEDGKIICFFDFADAEKEEYWEIIDSYKWRTELMWKQFREVVMPTIDNIDYEIYGESESVKADCPKIMDVDKTVSRLINEKCSLARFGDGEFELMCGRKRADFQEQDAALKERLKEVLHSQIPGLMIAIADNYSGLDKYTSEAARDIRTYLTRERRKEHMKLLELDRQYYDAYLSRPYMIYRDKSDAGRKFESIRRIWEQKEVLLVEGKYTRFGVGNDLLDNASRVSRIVVPDKNAFASYDEIIEKARENGKGKLIITILGPTATVLAYDLAKEGYWILDMGQLDIEYEWYLRGVEKRCDIWYKSVSEVARYETKIVETDDEFISKYRNEIICDIS